MSVYPSGQQIGITWEEQPATVVELGGGISCYAAGDRDVLDPYSTDAMCEELTGRPSSLGPTASPRDATVTVVSTLRWI